MVGIITFEDVEKVPLEKRNGTTVGEVMTTELVVAYPDESLESCLQKLVVHDIGRLPVVAKDNNKELLGLITKTDIIKVHARSSAEGRE